MEKEKSKGEKGRGVGVRGGKREKMRNKTIIILRQQGHNWDEA